MYFQRAAINRTIFIVSLGIEESHTVTFKKPSFSEKRLFKEHGKIRSIHGLMHFAMIPLNMESTIFSVTSNDQGRRLDRILRRLFKDDSLSFIYKALREKKILVNGKKSAPDYRCQTGDSIEIFIPLNSSVNEAEIPEPQQQESAEALKPMILCETPDLLFLNKPRGMLAHDGKGSLEALVQAYYQASNPEKSLAFKPGPLHRLDRNTSGIITFSKSLAGAHQFSSAMREGQLKKTYLAILDGKLAKDQSWIDDLSRDETLKMTQRAGAATQSASKSARTDVWPLAVRGGFTFAAIKLFSGRTHQIRAHASIHGYPLSGDRKYGSKTDIPYYFLHAWSLNLEKLQLSPNPEQVQASLPSDFMLFLFKKLCLPEKEVYSLLEIFMKTP